MASRIVIFFRSGAVRRSLSIIPSEEDIDVEPVICRSYKNARGMSTSRRNRCAKRDVRPAYVLPESLVSRRTIIRRSIDPIRFNIYNWGLSSHSSRYRRAQYEYHE